MSTGEEEGDQSRMGLLLRQVQAPAHAHNGRVHVYVPCQKAR